MILVKLPDFVTIYDGIPEGMTAADVTENIKRGVGYLTKVPPGKYAENFEVTVAYYSPYLKKGMFGSRT